MRRQHLPPRPRRSDTVRPSLMSPAWSSVLYAVFAVVSVVLGSTSGPSLRVRAFSPSAPVTVRRPHPGSTRRYAQEDDDEDDRASTMDPLTKASWYAVEAFGKVFGGKQRQDGGTTTAAAVDLTMPPASLREAIRRIELDNDRSYFLSGEVDVEAYDPDCVFADPFVAFSGRDRFVDNLANLGSFITEYDARMLKYEVDDTVPVVNTKVMVKLELNLPWKPILAWPWGVAYTLDPTSFLITDHRESWDIEPLEGVKQIFRKPTTTIKKRPQ